MTVEAVTLLLALLAVVAQVVVVAAVVLAVAARTSPAAARLRTSVVEVVRPEALALAAAVAAVATAGSLYLSEVAGFTPCRLCWYQRAAMYPLVPLLALAAWRGGPRLRWAALGLAVGGGAISTYHLAVERYPSLEGAVACEPSNPCSVVWLRHFGYLTIPGMALSGFALIATLVLVARPRRFAPALPSTPSETTASRGAAR